MKGKGKVTLMGKEADTPIEVLDLALTNGRKYTYRI